MVRSARWCWRSVVRWGTMAAQRCPCNWVNAFAGALGVALFYATTRTATGRTDAALPAALLLGGSYAFWYYAVEIEVYTVATLFLIICLALIIRPLPWNARRSLALGVAQGGAVLFHQTNVLFCVPVAVIALADMRMARMCAPLSVAGLRMPSHWHW
jgi:hypothetical protein